MNIITKIGFLVMLLAIGCSENKDTFYPDINTARKAGAIDRGWLPEIMPESSRDIHELHNLDTNRIWVRFVFNKEDLRSILVHVEELTQPEVKQLRIADPGSVDWWHLDFHKEVLALNGIQPKFKTYKYTKPRDRKNISGFFMIDTSAGVAYYWQPES